MDKLKGKILQKASMADESATVVIETEDGKRFEWKVTREQARGGYHVGGEIEISVKDKSKSADENKSIETQTQPSSETNAMMNKDLPTGANDPQAEASHMEELTPDAESKITSKKNK